MCCICKKKVLESFVFLPVGNKNEKLQPSLGQRMHTYSLSVLSVETLTGLNYLESMFFLQYLLLVLSV